MGAVWFWIVALMLAAYVVLDGFDIGIGILYPILGRSGQDRKVMLRSIGPVWDGNEVWLLASGGTLFFAFPILYASAFSGFYLPLMIVLWLLIGRGIGIELRSQVDNAVWRSFFDGVFFLSSALLAIFLGAALANVIRGVPLGADHYFFLPLWTDWRAGSHPGILDWYTVIGGVVALVALTTHGSLYLALKASGELEDRALRCGRLSWLGLCIMTLISLPATVLVRPAMLTHYSQHPAAFAIPAMVVLSLAGTGIYMRRREELKAFLSSCLYLATMLVGAAVGLYPTLLPSSSNPGDDITVANALSGTYAMHVGLIWWIFGISLALGYFVVSYSMFRGKVPLHDDGYGH
ncbi:cytochrome d ubiquinol oxidase subunit II [Silvibacterium acidisoli]|uniref:cytochrome d ubiquinol oxidase subunit II n=1 Tax=Acidobacteriaceae bacterium ZG23-2 TaxID=2883246 RepID=UPI00406C3C22